MTTTTVTAILRHLVEVIEDLTPDQEPERGWRLSRPPERPLRPWITAAGGGDRFRLFEIDSDESDDIGVNDPAATLVTAEVALTVAYPTAPRLPVLGGRFELAALMREDGLVLRDAINSVGGRANVAHVATQVSRPRLDRALEDVWFLEIGATVAFYIEQRPRT